MTGQVDTATMNCQHGTIPPPCKSVLFDLVRLQAGDRITASWKGESLDFTVVAKCYIRRDDRNWDAVALPGTAPSLTIFTGAGSFTRESGYSHHVVLRAELNPGTISPGCPFGNSTGPV
jgi:hypothetical protein